MNDEEMIALAKYLKEELADVVDAPLVEHDIVNFALRVKIIDGVVAMLATFFNTNREEWFKKAGIR